LLMTLSPAFRGFSTHTLAHPMPLRRWGASMSLAYYRTAHKAIPRAIWLACLGWEAMRPKERELPRALPTAREYAAMHA